MKVGIPLTRSLTWEETLDSSRDWKSAGLPLISNDGMEGDPEGQGGKGERQWRVWMSYPFLSSAQEVATCRWCLPRVGAAESSSASGSEGPS